MEVTDDCCVGVREDLVDAISVVVGCPGTEGVSCSRRPELVGAPCFGFVVEEKDTDVVGDDSWAVVSFTLLVSWTGFSAFEERKVEFLVVEDTAPSCFAVWFVNESFVVMFFSTGGASVVVIVFSAGGLDGGDAVVAVSVVAPSDGRLVDGNVVMVVVVVSIDGGLVASVTVIVFRAGGLIN